MYLNHYQFQVNPFQPATDPTFFWQGAQYGTVLAALRRGIDERQKLMLLTGDVGTGKTTIVNGLIRHLDERVHVFRISDPGLDCDDFFCVIADFLGWPTDFSGKGDVVRGYRQFLSKISHAGETLLVVVDEAQRLSADISDVLRQFLELGEGARCCVSILLVGQPKLERMLARSEHQGLRRHVSGRFSIAPLTRDETGAYIKHRIHIAGVDRKLFFEAAVEAVFVFSAGYPRLINTICDIALLTAYAKGVQYIGSGLVKECGLDLQVPMPPDICAPEATEDSPPTPPAVDAAAGNQRCRTRPYYRMLLVVFLFLGTVSGMWVLFHGRAFLTWRPSRLEVPQSVYRVQMPSDASFNHRVVQGPAKAAPEPSSGNLLPGASESVGKAPEVKPPEMAPVLQRVPSQAADQASNWVLETLSGPAFLRLQHFPHPLRKHPMP